MNTPIGLQNPFIGLRPFDSGDSLYYFGRKQQTRALLKQLDTHRFVAVVGSSGCGKSSLVRAGLIPNLEAGFLVQDRDLWKMMILKPGDAPLRNLASAVASVSGTPATAEEAAGMLGMMARQGAQALLHRLGMVANEDDANLLIVVDQFEELFRFQQTRTTSVREEAAAFVSILLSLASHRTIPVYVVLTMRSDFLGHCDAFEGLPEAMNASQYLVPRLTRQQRREAIMGPIRLAGADLTPRLLDRLLNESLDTRDDLPVLQHVLLRTWNAWAQEGKGPIDLAHYEKTGTIRHALSVHADEALTGLDAGRREIAKRMFQALTETDSANRRIRRPAHLLQLAVICGRAVAPETVWSLIMRFNADDRNFLVLSSPGIHDDPWIDISHESLIRQWKTLSAWADEEAESARIYKRLAESAELHAAAKAGLYREADLLVALEWQRRQQPVAAWAARYHPEFVLATDFLDKSVRRQKTNRAFVAALLVCVYGCLYGWLVVATTDDVSLATNSATLPIIGTRMSADQIYAVLPLLLASVHAYFLFYLQRLLRMFSHPPADSSDGRSPMSGVERIGLYALAWLTVPVTLIGVWVKFLPRRELALTGLHVVFITLVLALVLIFQRSVGKGKSNGSRTWRQSLNAAGAAGILSVALVLSFLSLGSYHGTPAVRWKASADRHALVPWIFDKLGYDLFLDLRETSISKLPADFFNTVLEGSSPELERWSMLGGASLKRANLRYADLFRAFLPAAILRNSDLTGARVRQANLVKADIRGADLNNADLRGADLRRTDFREADLRGADFFDADLRQAQLGMADMRGASLKNTRLEGADLRCTKLVGVRDLDLKSLWTVSSLYRVELEDASRAELARARPQLFEKPSAWHDMTMPHTEKKKDICE